MFFRKKNALLQKELADAIRDTKTPPQFEDLGVDALTLTAGIESLPNSPYIKWVKLLSSTSMFSIVLWILNSLFTYKLLY